MNLRTFFILSAFCYHVGGSVVYRSERASPVVLREYRSYGDVEMMHFKVPDACLSSSWRLRASTNEKCPAKNVTISFRQGGFPIFNPKGVALPDNIHLPVSWALNASLLSDNETVLVNQSNPRPGDWFLGAIISRSSEAIVPGGMARDCRVKLHASVSYELLQDVIFLIPEIHDYQNIKLYQEVRGSQYYKFFVPADTWRVNVTVSKCSSRDALRGVVCPVLLSASAESLPSLQDPYTTWINCSHSSRSSTCTFEFSPREDAWHFLKIESFSSSTEVTLQIGYHSCSYQAPQQSYFMMTELSPRQICASLLKNVSQPASMFRNVYYLVQRSQPDYFSKAGCLERTYLERISGQSLMNYSFTMPNEIDSFLEASSVEISVSMNPHLFSFDLHSITDIGGTLSVGFHLKGKGYGRMLDVPETNPGIKVFGCLSHDRRAELITEGDCSVGTYLQVNSSFDSATSTEVHIPFPLPGRWYFTLMAQCYVDDGLRGYSPVDSDACRDEAALVKLDVSAGPCEKGSCQNSGRCRWYSSCGFFFSGCHCVNGYQGLFCNDGSKAVPQYMQLLSVLLLTVSNVMFVPAIGLAVVRRFFTEAVMYAATMAFSTLYHACDQEGRYSFCLVDNAVLQALDFYCGLLSFWVTLIAMASLPWVWKSCFQLLGAIGIVLAVKMDRESMWAFIIPTAFAALVLFTSWIVYCRLDKRCYPGRKFFLFGLLPGLATGAAGLAIFGFLETYQNYFLTHSAWHMLMASSICFLLPFANASNDATSREEAYGLKSSGNPGLGGSNTLRRGRDQQVTIQPMGVSGSISGGLGAGVAAEGTVPRTATLKRAQNRAQRGSVNHGRVPDDGEERGMDTWLAQSPAGNKTVVSVTPHAPDGQSSTTSSAPRNT